MPITELSQLDINKTYTYLDYISWQFQERVELLRGKIALMSPAPNLAHQRVLGRMHILMGQFLFDHPCQIFMAPFDVRLARRAAAAGDPIYTVVQPDLCVVCDTNKLDEQGCVGAPDLVVEVLSPGNSRKEMREKFDLYQEAGVLEYWLVDPDRKTIIVYLLDDQGVFMGKQPLTDQEIMETDLLPGFAMKLGEVFGK